MSVKTGVKLTNSEASIARAIGKRRYESARNKKVFNGKKGPQSNYETDLEGAGSELAAAKLLNLWPDLQVEKIPTHDLIFNGKSIDVKTTKYKEGKLIAGLNKNKKSCDYYMLMIGSFPEYYCAGFAKKETLLSEDTITNLGWGNLHALSQQKLINIEEFIDETKT
jgi:hypothetical protein